MVRNPLTTLDFKPCETVILTAMVYDNDGRPAKDCELTVFGFVPGTGIDKTIEVYLARSVSGGSRTSGQIPAQSTKGPPERNITRCRDPRRTAPKLESSRSQ